GANRLRYRAIGIARQRFRVARELGHEELMDIGALRILIHSTGRAVRVNIAGCRWILFEERLKISGVKRVHYYVAGCLRRVRIFGRAEISLDTDHVAGPANVAQRFRSVGFLPQRYSTLLNDQKKWRIRTALPT